MLQEVADTSSKLKKVEIIVRYLREKPKLHAYIEACLHPYKQYHITSKKAMSHVSAMAEDVRQKRLADADFHVLAVLKQLCLRKITGGAAWKAWSDLVLLIGLEYKETLGQIVDKKFKCHCSVATFNKAFKELGLPLIPVFRVALGEGWEKFKKPKVWLEKTKWYSSRKIDGIRCLVILQEGLKPKYLGRKGAYFDGLSTFDIYFQGKHKGPPIVLDGELGVAMPNGEDNFKAVQSQLNSLAGVTNPVLRCFDMLTLEEFQAGKSKRIFSERQKALKDYVEKLDLPSVTKVIQVPLKSEADYEKHREIAIRKKWEGLMFRADKPYTGKRSRDIYKVKEFIDAEYTVIDSENGPFEITENGKTRIIETMRTVHIKHKGKIVGVGSGFSLDERKTFYWNPEKIVGKVITVRYKQETIDKDRKFSLQFPTFKCLHGNKRQF
jgi:DNA ligase-1